MSQIQHFRISSVILQNGGTYWNNICIVSYHVYYVFRSILFYAFLQLWFYLHFIYLISGTELN